MVLRPKDRSCRRYYVREAHGATSAPARRATPHNETRLHAFFPHPSLFHGRAMSDDCTICSEPLGVPGASLTKCGHVFHTYCIEKWFEQKPLCPLCKTRAGPGFTRALRAPVPLSEEDLERIRTLEAANPAGPEMAMAELQAAAQRYAHEAEVCAEARDSERQAVAHKRAGVHQLESQLLRLKRELAAAQRVEASATAALSTERDAAAAAEGSRPVPPPVVALDADKQVSVEAVKQQSKQLLWRCQELRELEEKIVAREAVSGAARTAAKRAKRE